MLDDDYFRLARHQPSKVFVDACDTTLHPIERSWAIEALGIVEDRDKAISLLMRFLEDPDPKVREGAVHGIAYHLDVPCVREWLEKIGAVDESMSVREAVEVNL
jgi:hypothetical protein